MKTIFSQPKGSVMIAPSVQVRPTSGSTPGLPFVTSISSGKNGGFWRVKPFGPLGVL